MAIADLEPRSALSVPIDLGDGPIGTLDLYATNPRGWDHTDVCALQTYAGVVAGLLGTAATAHIGGWLADQLQLRHRRRHLRRHPVGGVPGQGAGRPAGRGHRGHQVRLDAGRGEGRRQRRWAAQACEDSLRRLGTDRIDLYQLHRPDDSVPIAETLGRLDELVRAGKVLRIGNSNFSAAQIDEAAAGPPRAEPRS